MECQREKPRKKGFTVPSKAKVTDVPCKKDAKERKEEIKTSLNYVQEHDQETEKEKKTTVFHKQNFKKTEILKDTQNKKRKKLTSSLTDQDYEDIFQNVLKESESKGVVKESESEGVLKDPESENALVKQSGGDIEKSSKIKAEQVSNQEEIQKNIKAENSEVQEENPKKIKGKQVVGREGKPRKIRKKQSGDLEGNKSQNRAKESQDPKEKITKTKIKEVDQQDTMISVKDDDEEEGTWIQCTNLWCNRWRYVPDIADPISVPELWECSMNPDVLHKSCNDEQEFYDESEQIVTKYTPGSLVWVKMGGFPWWPALVECDPDYDLYYELPNEESMDPSKFHVTFFGKRVSRAWIKTTHILPYTKKMPAECRLTKKCASLRLEMAVAVTDAQEALTMGLKERLLKYGFSGRYSSKLKTAKSDTYEYDSEDEVVEEKENIPKKKRKISEKHSDSFRRKKTCNTANSKKADLACLDQHVPDIIQPILEEEISMDNSVNDGCDKPQDKVNNLKQSSEIKDLDDIPAQKCISKESLSSADPVPDIDNDRDKNPKKEIQSSENKDLDDIPTQKCISEESLLSADPVPDIDNNCDKNQKEEIADEGEIQLDLDLKDESTNLEDKWHYGHFMGHSSDHGSDSDPFDIIED